MREDLVQWQRDGWRGHVAAACVDAAPEWLAIAASNTGRRSRHARTQRVVGNEGEIVFVKHYPAPDGRRAERAWRMGTALAGAGFSVPAPLLIVRRAREGLLVTRAAAAAPLMSALAAPHRERRMLLGALGALMARLHAAGFVHGDLVPSNLLVAGPLAAPEFVLLDNDRTRRGALLVWWGGRRNLVQLGRFVVPRVTLTDRARVLAAYARGRRLDRPARRRLAWWVERKTMARRCAIDHIAAAEAARVGYRTLMRSGGPFDRS